MCDTGEALVLLPCCDMLEVVSIEVAGFSIQHASRCRGLRGLVAVEPSCLALRYGEVGHGSSPCLLLPMCLDVDNTHLVLIRSPGSYDIEQIGRAHVCTPVTNAHIVCSLLIETTT